MGQKNGFHAFGYSFAALPKVNRFGWNLEYCEPNVGGWPLQTLGAIRAVAAVWEGAEILFFFIRWITHDFNDFPSEIFYDISTQQRRSVSPCKLSEQNFENFTTKGHVSKQTQQLHTRFTGLTTSGRYNSAMITNAENSWLNGHFMGCLASIFKVTIDSKSFP